jgi:prepilin-type N-terminal cleavage/methylation domain-containing protein
MSPTTTWNERGYTLIELSVVLWIVALTFFIVYPAFRVKGPGDGLGEVRRHLSGLTRDLRYQAVREHRDIDLRIYLNAGKMAFRGEGDGPEIAYVLPAGVSFGDVEYRGGVKVADGETAVRFYDNGMVDPVVLHFREGERVMSLLVEPFLGELRTADRYVSYDGSGIETGGGEPLT